jgi:hypothetical protein
MSRNKAEEAVSVVSLISSSLGGGGPFSKVWIMTEDHQYI